MTPDPTELLYFIRRFVQRDTSDLSIVLHFSKAGTHGVVCNVHASARGVDSGCCLILNIRQSSSDELATTAMQLFIRTDLSTANAML